MATTTADSFKTDQAGTKTGNDCEDGKRKALPVATLAALGVVFGDLGTSPLYTMQAIVGATGSQFQPHAALGILSLIVWSLIVVVSIKYCVFVMRADNEGEGGILALMSLTGVDQWRRRTFVLTVMGLLGAALIYGDGVITPAISVLSALEGVNVVTDRLAPYVLPAGLAILIALFSAQKMGTARIGAAFGPIMLLWFVTIAALGISGVVRHPGVLVALDPGYAIAFLGHERAVSLLILGGVFLCSTGGEALYADMGHVGRRPVRVAWYAVVLPALLMSYAGQTAMLLDGGAPGKNPFFLLAPHWMRYPLVGLATLATIIASQAIITGSFSMTRQAVQLGWLPRIKVKQTSSDSKGQIYVPDVNWAMAVATIAIMLAFQTSDRLSGAYGMAVSTTMLLTTCLLYRAMRTVWKWPLIAVVPLIALFLIVDLGFFGANLLKLAEGGYVPLALALLILLMMLTWRQGAHKVDRIVSEATASFDAFLTQLKADRVPRTPGVGVFLTSPGNDVPPIIADTVKTFGALKESVIVLSVAVAEVPRIPAARRSDWKRLGDGFWQVQLHYGFMQTPNIPIALRGIEELASSIDLENAHYFAARDFVVRDGKTPAMSAWRTRLFAFMFRNGARAPDEFHLPVGTTVEIARQIGI